MVIVLRNSDIKTKQNEKTFTLFKKDIQSRACTWWKLPGLTLCDLTPLSGCHHFLCSWRNLSIPPRRQHSTHLPKCSCSTWYTLIRNVWLSKRSRM